MPSKPSTEVLAPTSESFHFGYLTLSQIHDVDRLHPAVANAIATDSRHAPTHLRVLETCPDRDPDFPCFFYVTYRDRVVASLRAFPDHMYADGKVYSWAWCCDLFTDPDLRGKGLALMVVEGSIPVLHQRGIAWGGLFASPVTNHICVRLGMALPGFGPRLMLMKSIRPFAAYALRSRQLGYASDIPYRMLFSGLVRPWLARRLRGGKGYRVKIVDDLDAFLKHPMPAQVYDAQFRFTDSMEKLAWKVRSGHSVQLQLILDASTQAPLGYLVFKQRSSSQTFMQQFGTFELLTLMDFGVFGGLQNYDVVLQAAINHFLHGSADMLEIVSSSRTLNRLAFRRGFLPIGKGTPIIFHFPPAWTLGDAPFDPGNWRLTHYASDGFAFR